jgi:hypothetical protein
MTVYRKSGGTWNTINKIYRKSGGVWESIGSVYRKAGGVWQKVFASLPTPSIESQVLVTLSTTATQTKRLTGTLYRWNNATSVTYTFNKGTNGTTYTPIAAPGTSTNPATGTSNTLDAYTIAQADMVANVTNYFIYVSKGINATYSTSQTSASDYVIVESPRDIASFSSTSFTNQINLSWTNPLYANLFEYQYKTTAGATWSTSFNLVKGTTTTSISIAGLVENTSYDIRVRGWTGTIAGYGYFGNWVTASGIFTLPPQPPNNVISSSASLISSTGFRIDWSAPTVDGTHSAATSYDYGVTTSNVTAPATTNTANTYAIPSTAAGTTYYVWIKAKNAGGPSAGWHVSAPVTTPILKPPNNPSGVVLGIRSTNSLDFSWTAPSADATHNVAQSYVYNYGTSSTNSGTYPYETGSNAPAVTIGGAFFPLAANTTYYIFIKAKNADGLSAGFATGSGSTLALANPPGLPGAMSASNYSQSGMMFTWSAGTGGAPVGYYFGINTSSTTPPTTYGFTYTGGGYIDVGSVISFRAIGLAPSTSYYGWVKAYNSDGESTGGAYSGWTRSSIGTTIVAPTISNPLWSTNVNFQRITTTQNPTNPSLRYGWANGSVSPTTGTYTTISPAGFFFEIWPFSNATGTLYYSNYYSYSTTLITTALVNNVAYPYAKVFTNTSSPAYTSSAVWGRIMLEAYDFDFKSWYAPWTGTA